MRQTCTIGILAVIWLLTPAATAMAQMHPTSHGHYGHYSGYGDYGYGDAGVWGMVSSAMNNSSSRYVAEQNRLAGQQAALQQQQMMQSGIRNTLMTQAEARTQDLTNQRQAGRDWWFQVQQQQVAQRQSAAAHAPMTPVAGFESATPAASRPQAATDIIKWQPILCDSRFAQQRAKVETPYRRTPKTNPTAADYQNMIDAAQQMKVILGQMTADISAQEYLNAEKYLDQLAAEARGRIEQQGKKAADQPGK